MRVDHREFSRPVLSVSPSAILRKEQHCGQPPTVSFRGDLGAFANRVNMCYGLGLITKGMRQNLETVGEIRNLFGHTHLSLDFTDPSIKALCEKLTFPKIHEVIGGEGDDPFGRIKGPRNRFSTITFMLANRLLLTGLATKHRDRLDKGWE
jgi:hypothetical protein